MSAPSWWSPVVTTLASNPALERLFFASLELAALAVLLMVALRLFRVRSARLVSLLWLVLLVKPVLSLCFPPLAPVIELRTSVVADVSQSRAPASALSYPGAGLTGIPSASPSFSPRLAPTAAPGSEVVPSATASTSPLLHKPSLATLIFATWLTGIGVTMAAALVDRLRLSQVLRTAMPPGDELAARYRVLASEMRIAQPPRLLLTDRLDSPALAGIIRPAVLLPAWLAADGASAEVEWALRHELAHWKHRDPWANLLRQAAQTVLFFHPMVWVAGRKWEEAAELACDRALVDSSEEARLYAESLYQLLARLHARRRPYALGGLFATRTQIGKRIAALATAPFASPARLGGLSLLALAAFAGLAFTLGGRVADGAVRSHVIEPGGRSCTGPFKTASWLLPRTKERTPLQVTAPGSGRPDMIHLKEMLFRVTEEKLHAEITGAVTTWPVCAWEVFLDLYDGDDVLLAHVEHRIENSGEIRTRPLHFLTSYDLAVCPANVADKAEWFRVVIAEAPSVASAETESAAPAEPGETSIKVKGRVTDAGGNPLGGVAIAALRTSGVMVFGIGEGKTDSEGRYALDLSNQGGGGNGGWPSFPVQIALKPALDGWFERDRWQHASLYMAGERPSPDNEWHADPERVLTPRAEPYEIDFVMEPGALLRGRIHRPDGTGYSQDVHLTWERQPERWDAFVTIDPDEEGRFTCTAPVGEIWLSRGSDSSCGPIALETPGSYEADVVIDEAVDPHRLSCTLVLEESAESSPGSPPVAESAQVPVESAAWLDGKHDYYEAPPHPALNLGETFSIEAWVSFSEGGTLNPRILSKGWESGGGYEFVTESTESVRSFGFLTTGLRDFQSMTRIGADRWYHLAAVCDGQMVWLYVNGELAGSARFSGPIKPNGYPLVIGRNSQTGRDYFRGSIAEVSLWDVARDQDALRGDMTRPLTGAEAGLIACWRPSPDAKGVLTDVGPNRLDAYHPSVMGTINVKAKEANGGRAGTVQMNPWMLSGDTLAHVNADDDWSSETLWVEHEAGRVWQSRQNTQTKYECMFGQMRPGTYRVTAYSVNEDDSGDPTPFGCSDPVAVELGDAPHEVVVKLMPGHSTELRFIDEDSGGPVPHVEYILQTAGGFPVGYGSNNYHLRAGEGGVVTFRALPPGKYVLRARTSAGRPEDPAYSMQVNPKTFEVREDGQRIEVPMTGRPQTEEEIARRWPFVVFGTVTDKQDRPVPGVEVSASCGIGTLWRTGHTVSGEDGAYTLRFGPGMMRPLDEETGEWRVGHQAATIYAYKEGYYERNLCRQGGLTMADERPAAENVWGANPDEVVLPNQPYRLDFVMVRGCAVSGVLVDGAGVRLIGKQITISGPELYPSSSVFRQSETDEEGRFSITDVPCKTFWFEADGVRCPPISFVAPGPYAIELSLTGDPAVLARNVLSVPGGVDIKDVVDSQVTESPAQPAAEGSVR